jgi:hypothetical protein
MTTNRLTKWQINAMREAMANPEIFNRGIAMRLREVANNHPGLIIISNSKPRQESHQQPYCRAVLTMRGIDAITDTKRRRTIRAMLVEARA